MKIQGPGRSGGVKGTSKTGGSKKTGDASFDSMVGEDDSVDSARNVSGGASVSSLGALLSMQDIGSATDETKRKAKHRADVILDQLDRLKLALLEGRLPRSVLEDLMKMIKSQRESVNDPKLTEILDEIDLRAQVELAKYERDPY